MTLHKNRTQICTVSYGDNGLGHMCGHSVGQGAPAVPPPSRACCRSCGSSRRLPEGCYRKRRDKIAFENPWL